VTERTNVPRITRRTNCPSQGAIRESSRGVLSKLGNIWIKVRAARSPGRYKCNRHARRLNLYRRYTHVAITSGTPYHRGCGKRSPKGHQEKGYTLEYKPIRRLLRAPIWGRTLSKANQCQSRHEAVGPLDITSSPSGYTCIGVSKEHTMPTTPVRRIASVRIAITTG
jgi:hypothetical protein